MAKLVSKVYGDALFSAAVETGALDTVYEETLALQSILKDNPELTALLDNPQVTREEKQEVIKNIFSGRVSEDTLGFLTTVIEKGRQDELKAILDYFVAAVKEYKKIGIAHVTSAASLSESQKEAIEKRLLETTEYVRFEMNYAVDTSLIGGLVIRIGDRVVDSSIKTQIYELKKDLLNVQLT